MPSHAGRCRQSHILGGSHPRLETAQGTLFLAQLFTPGPSVSSAKASCGVAVSQGTWDPSGQTSGWGGRGVRGFAQH